MSSASRSSRTSARSTAAPGRPSPLTVGNVDQCPYCQAAHTAGGKAAGLTGDEMISVRRGNVETDPKLDALLAVARKLPQLRGLGVDEGEVGTQEDWHGGSRRTKR